MLKIRPVTTMAECRLIGEITASAWGTDLTMAVPDHLIITIAREKGGVVLMAWDDKRPVGFCLGFLSFSGDGRRLKHTSHMAGVIPEYRGRQVGEMLKWAQRDAVLAMGIDLITWTYDPLETLNGRLNIHKLGATCSTYKRDHYGEVSDALSRGLPTDRFRVDWPISSSWVQSHREGGYASPSVDELLNRDGAVVNPPMPSGDGLRAGASYPDALTSENPLVAVPRDFQGLKKSSIAEAAAWRSQTREIFEKAFASDLVVYDLILKEGLCYYLLGRRDRIMTES